MFDMPECSLNFPDEPWWRDEEDYNIYAAFLLLKADIELRRGHHSAEAHRKAMRLVEDWHDATMSRRQRMRIFYVMACACDALDDSSEGLTWIDKALPLAFELESDYDVGKLLADRAAMNRDELFFARAAEDARDSLRVIDEHEAELNPTEVTATRLGLLPQLASYEFYIADFDATKEHLELARKLIARTPNAILPAAATAWTQAQLDIYNRIPGVAVSPSLEICEIYQKKGSAISYERARILAAQVALAFAEILPTGTTRDLAIEMAAPHITAARHLAATIQDQPGIALCMLVRAHYDRLANSNNNRKHVLGEVIQIAEDINDIALMAQAHTILGDEYTADGQVERAKVCYRITIDLVRESELPALAFPARRALGGYGEDNT